MTMVGFVNIVAMDRTDYYFDDLPKSVQADNYVLLYQRKN